MVDADPRAEALLYVRWVRGAVGRFDGADELGGEGPTPRAAGPVAAAGRRPPASAATIVEGPDVQGPEGPERPEGPEGPGPEGAVPPADPSSGSVVAAEGSASPSPEGHGGDLAGGVPPVSSAAAGLAVDGRPTPRSGKAHEAPPPDADAGDLDALAATAAVCRRCRLCETRTTVVFGEGPRRPRLMVIGEAPGAEEDATGRPFVGRAGVLLTKMLAAIGLSRDDVYIANVLKCRPPDNRPPSPDEMSACRPYLVEQIRLLDPELLLLLGTPATRAVLGTDRGITALRGQLLRTPDGRPAVPTFHPAYLLRNPDAKREAWLDLQRVATILGLTVPPRGGSPP